MDCYHDWRRTNPEIYIEFLKMGRSIGIHRPQDNEKKGENVQCSYCGSLIYRKLSEIKNNKSGNFYCDAVCMGNAWKGNNSPCYDRMMQFPPMKNPISKKKMIESLKGKHCGPGNPNWRGGVSFGQYCPKFNSAIKEEVRNKFGRRCFICGKDESINKRKLDVHHVDYDKYQGCDGKKWMLVPLCRSCHSKTSGGNREQWNTYLVDKLHGYCGGDME